MFSATWTTILWFKCVRGQNFRLKTQKVSTEVLWKQFCNFGCRLPLSIPFSRKYWKNPLTTTYNINVWDLCGIFFYWIFIIDKFIASNFSMTAICYFFWFFTGTVCPCFCCFGIEIETKHTSWTDLLIFFSERTSRFWITCGCQGSIISHVKFPFHISVNAELQKFYGNFGRVLFKLIALAVRVLLRYSEL